MTALVLILYLFFPCRLCIFIRGIGIASLDSKSDAAFLNMPTGVCSEALYLPIASLDVCLLVQAEMSFDVDVASALKRT